MTSRFLDAEDELLGGVPEGLSGFSERFLSVGSRCAIDPAASDRVEALDERELEAADVLADDEADADVIGESMKIQKVFASRIFRS